MSSLSFLDFLLFCWTCIRLHCMPLDNSCFTVGILLLADRKGLLQKCFGLNAQREKNTDFKCVD